MKKIAFIFEGETEQIFYFHLLDFFAQKYNMQREEVRDQSEIYHLLGENIIIKHWTVGTITQVPTSGRWFNRFCVSKNDSRDWIVFLCYDTDEYKNDITKFDSDDWSELRKNLGDALVIDIAAAADIEDVMLTDFDGVSRYMGLNPSFTLADFPGRKGKVKMKAIGRCGKPYHEGIRAKPLIEALDMQKIIDSHIVPLEQIELHIFG